MENSTSNYKIWLVSKNRNKQIFIKYAKLHPYLNSNQEQLHFWSMYTTKIRKVNNTVGKEKKSLSSIWLVRVNWLI